MTHLFFFRGLNTYGHDNAQLSILKLGPMARHLAVAFGARGVAFHPVLGMGVGPIAEVTERAATALAESSVWADDVTPVHLFGHSAGGLVVRLLLDRFGPRRLTNGAPKIASALTMATPHLGSGLAQIFIEMPNRYRASAALFKAVGYDLRSKTAHFATLTPAAVAETLAHVDPSRYADVATGAIVCAPPRARWSRPMRAFHKLPAFRAFAGPSDGMVEGTAQTFGDHEFPIDLDHFQQAGFFGANFEFERMCDVVAKFAADALTAATGAGYPSLHDYDLD